MNNPGGNKAVQHLKRMLKNILVRGILSYEVLFQALQVLLLDDRVYGKVLSDDLLGKRGVLDNRAWQKILADDCLLDKILADDRLLDRILADDRSIRRILLDHRLRSKLRFVNARKEIAGLGYALPTFLVSFPRSGSNFLQTVLQGASGLRCQSIYAPLLNDSEPVLSLKSHAVSLEYLFDEIHRFISKEPRPSKIVLLYRDPRDVMISFYEYTQAQKNTQISQSEFLNNYDYFLAAPIDRECRRKVEYAPISVGQAYKKHVRRWFVEPLPDHLDCLVVKYEDLVQEPQQEFQRIFDFLGLKCSLVEQIVDVQVSQYSSEPRQRGQAYGWKDNFPRYKALLEEVNLALRDEIIVLGYQP